MYMCTGHLWCFCCVTFPTTRKLWYHYIPGNRNMIYAMVTYNSMTHQLTLYFRYSHGLRKLLLHDCLHSFLVKLRSDQHWPPSHMTTESHDHTYFLVNHSDAWRRYYKRLYWSYDIQCNHSKSQKHENIMSVC